MNGVRRELPVLRFGAELHDRAPRRLQRRNGIPDRRSKLELPKTNHAGGKTAIVKAQVLRFSSRWLRAGRSRPLLKLGGGDQGLVRSSGDHRFKRSVRSLEFPVLPDQGSFCRQCETIAPPSRFLLTASGPREFDPSASRLRTLLSNPGRRHNASTMAGRISLPQVGDNNFEKRPHGCPAPAGRLTCAGCSSTAFEPQRAFGGDLAGPAHRHVLCAWRTHQNSPRMRHFVSMLEDLD